MYKFIIGNVRISVVDDDISHDQAINTARQAILTAGNQNKLLSHIEINKSEDGIEVNTTERSGAKMLRKSLKQSVLDSMFATMQTKLNPTDSFTTKDIWYDNDTGQEWRGAEVAEIRQDLLSKFEEWYKNV